MLKTNSAFSALFPGIQDQKFLNKFEISNSNITTEFIQIVENAQKSDKPVTSNLGLDTAKGQRAFNAYARRVDSLDKSIVLLSLVQIAAPRTKDMFEHAPVMMLQIDANGCLKRANKKWLDRTGYSWDEVKGNPLVK